MSLIYYMLCVTLSLIISCFSYTKQETEITQQKIVKVTKPLITIKDNIKYGETLSTILKKHNIAPQLAYKIITSFQKIYNVKHLQATQSYTIEKDSSGNFIKFFYQPNIEEQYTVFRNRSGNIISQINRIQLEKKINGITGEIKTSLYDAILELGESPELLIAISDIFQWDIDFFLDPRNGDQFKVIYETFRIPQNSTSLKSDKERFVRYGKILAAQYTLQGTELTAIYFDNSQDNAGYYTADGESFQKTFLKSPLNYRRISSYFSYSRLHPILKIVRPHYGVDFAAPTGTPVCASADGVVIHRGYQREIGNFIKIKHKNPRFVTLYGHLSKFATGIKKGRQVTQKEIIGYVGSTGLATGPHLHYTFYENGRPINPLRIKNTSGDPINEKNMIKFNELKQRMTAYLDYLNDIEIPRMFDLATTVHFNRYLISER